MAHKKKNTAYIPATVNLTAAEITQAQTDGALPPAGVIINVIDTTGKIVSQKQSTGETTAPSLDTGGGSPGDVFEDWAAGKEYAVGHKVLATVAIGAIGVGSRLRRNTAGTSGATFNTAEANKWTELVVDDDVVPKTDIVDNLTTSDATKVLSAKQGKDLQDLKAPLASPTFTGTVAGITKAMVGLGLADNVADISKPVSTAQQTALDGKSATTHNHAGTYEPSNANIQSHIVSTVNPHSVTKTQVGLGLADNVADISKPISTAQQTAFDLKVDKITGKGLSTNDYTTAEQAKLLSIVAGAEVNVQPDWNQATTTLDDYIKNKPTIPAATVINNTLISTSATEALSAAQGKVLQDGKRELYSLGHPYATAATTYGHTVTASSEYSGAYAGWKAFQQTTDLYDWSVVSGGTPGWLSIELPSPVIFIRCALRGRYNGEYATRWKLEGSNDGSTFTTLLDKTAADESLQYSLGEKTYDFTNIVPYRFYRFYFTAGIGNFVGLNTIRWSHQGINILSNTSLTDGSVSAYVDELRFDRVRLISDTDLNVLAVSGFYDGTNLTNAPVASTSWFYVEHLQHSNAVAPGWAMQKAYGLGSPNSGAGAAGTMYVRTKVNAVWQAWRTVTTT